MVRFSLALGFILLLSPVGHAQEPPPGSAQAATPEEEEVRPKEKISKIQMYLKPFTYDREIYRDPFEAQTGQAPLEPGQVYGPFLEIQTFRLSDFTLKGLLWDTENPVAIFQAPNEKIYKLTIKDYIGENFGYIATIREKEVVVIQTIEENDRRYSTTKVVFLETVQGE
jgi:Tfp pilus assembly protein PilP